MQIRRVLYIVTAVVLTMAAVELRAESPAPPPSKAPSIKVVPTFSPSPIEGYLTIEEIEIPLNIGKPVPSVTIKYTDKVGARISLNGHDAEGSAPFECSGVVSSTRKVNCGPFVLSGSDLTPTTIKLNLN